MKEKTVSKEQKYNGKIINVRVDEVLFDGDKSHVREVVEHPGGVVVVPILEDNKVVLIRQWRHPIGQELIEIPAGKLDVKGEDIFDAAKRELEEETGFVANNWEYLGFIFTTPGFCDEKLHLYKAWDLTTTQTNLDYGEIIEPYIVDLEEAYAMIKEGKITDAKTIIGLNLIR